MPVPPQARGVKTSTLALSMLLASLGTSIANVALPTLTRAFHAPLPEVQWVVLAYLLAITVAIVAVGAAADVIGHRRMLLAGIAVFGVASVACGIAPTLGLLVAARAAQGLGAAVLMALTLALVRETVPGGKMGSAMGLLGTTSAIGTALGPSLGGALLAGPGWRALFLVLLPLALLNFGLAYRFLPADVHKGRLTTFDWRGTLSLAVALGAYAIAVTVGPRVLLLVAVAAAAGFLAAKRPVGWRDRTLREGLAMNGLVATVMMTTLVVGPFYLSFELGLKPALVGAVMSAGPVMSAITGVVAGRIVDRWGASRMVAAGLVVMAIGGVSLTTLPGVVGYVAALAVLTPGYQLFLTANNTAVMADVPGDRRGGIAGMLSLSRNLGLVTGASVMGAVFAATSAHVTFAVAAALIVAAIAIRFVPRLRLLPQLRHHLRGDDVEMVQVGQVENL